MHLSILDEDLKAVELEEKVWDVDEPHADANLLNASLPVKVIVIFEVQGSVSVADETGRRLGVRHENDCNESRNHEEYKSEGE